MAAATPSATTTTRNAATAACRFIAPFLQNALFSCAELAKLIDGGLKRLHFCRVGRNRPHLYRIDGRRQWRLSAFVLRVQGSAVGSQKLNDSSKALRGGAVERRVALLIDRVDVAPQLERHGNYRQHVAFG